MKVKSLTGNALVFLGVTLIGAMSIPGLAQTTTATLAGTVKDESGAVLPGVEITISNVETGGSRNAVSDDQGRYTIPELTSGSYEVQASLGGFQTVVRSGISLTVARRSVVDLVLPVGEIQERVVVTGEAPAVETTSSTIAGLVDDQKIRDLPLNGRSFSDLVTLQMGVTTMTIGNANNSSGFGLKMSSSGARPSDNSFLLDGNFVNDVANNTPSGGTGHFLGIETLKEFTVLTNTFSAEYGQSSGAIVNAVTKSGTNDLHGSLFYFHRNDNVDARNFFDLDATNPTERSDPPEFKRHQFGFTAGGPIIRNKTFIFGGYEGLREALGTSAIINSITEEARNGMIPGEPPFQLAPGVDEYLRFYPVPLPGARPGAPGAAEVSLIRTRVSDEDNFVIKVDHNFSDSDSLFVRYTFDDATVQTPKVNFDNLLETRNQYVTIEEKHIFSPSLLNVARIGFNRSSLTENETAIVPFPVDLQLVPPDRNAIPEIGEGRLGGFTVFGTGGGFFLGIGNNAILPRIFNFNLFEYSDTLSYFRGNHSLKFGFNIKRAQGNVIAPQRLYGSIIFNSISLFLQGNASIMQFIRPGSDLRRGLRTTVFGFFVQDDLQLTPKLTLNLGLRYEPQSDHTEVNGKVSNLRDFRNDSQLTVGDPFFDNPTKTNWAPRVGLAWDPFGDGKTAVRAGFGVFYNIQMFEMDIITATSNPPFAVIDAVFSFPQGNQGVQFPFDFDDLAAGAFGSPPALESTDFNMGQPYRMQWNLNVQREILRDTTLTVGYVGARGVDLIRVYQANQADPVPELCPDPCRSDRFFFPPGPTPVNPNFGAIVARSGGADSYYSSLQLSVNKRFSSGFQVQGNYTWGHSIDTSSKQVRNIGESQNSVNQLNPLDTAQDRSPSDFDTQHNLSINYKIDLPGQNLANTAGKLLGGWELGGIVTLSTGVPFTLTSGYDACRCLSGAQLGAFGGGDNRPDLIAGGDNNPVLNDGREPQQYFDASQFEQGPDGFYGNLARNTLRIPGVANFDFSLIKNTSIREGVDVQFRAEFFNLFNRANFAEPSGTLFSQTFSGSIVRNPGAGRIRRTTTSSRQIQFGLKVVF